MRLSQPLGEPAVLWENGAPGPQLGKLRASAAGSGAELGEWTRRDHSEVSLYHCGSPLFPAVSGAVVVRVGTPLGTYSSSASEAGRMSASSSDSSSL